MESSVVPRNAVFLTSKLDLYDKDVFGIRVPKPFGNQNGILNNLKRYIRNYDHFLFVSSGTADTEVTDAYARVTFESFAMTLPFAYYDVLDIRTQDRTAELVANADFIFLCGGHLPTQNAFFKQIQLREQLKRTNAVICGGSAGSMNCADEVYCPPEIEGESIDPHFQKVLRGLGLTNLNILPHYDSFRFSFLDGKRYLEDIIIPDSFSRDIYAINDGTYFLIADGKTQVFGECYLIQNGLIKKINEDGEIKELL